MSYLDVKYASFLSTRLDRYKVVQTSPYRANFRCPVCGDSSKNKTKARGWLLESTRDQGMVFYCHNCGASMGFRNFLKQQDPSLFDEYVSESFFKNKRETLTKPVKEKPKYEAPVFDKSPLSKIKKISQLKHDHPVKKYILERQIPANQHYRLYYAPKFRNWVNTMIPNKFPKIVKDEPRLIMPFLDKNKKFFGMAARGFDPKGLRYMSIMMSDSHPKVFGLDVVDFNKPYMVVEGAIDSLFLSNAIAMAGADGSALDSINKDNAILVYDNEPRNKEICSRMLKNIRAGYAVCIWPKHIEQKDINDMWLNGYRNVEDIIKENTHSGLNAELRLAAWKRC